MQQTNDIAALVAEAIRDEVRHSLSIVVKDGEATARRVQEILTRCVHEVNWSPRYRAKIAALATASDRASQGEGEVPECVASALPSGKHQVDTSMESGPNNCFFCGKPMPRPSDQPKQEGGE